jgi:tRNA-(ms[2]io[6]A)-hydroxylase
VEISDKKVLGLQLPTDPRWVNLAEMSIGDILTDHAWCEQKAATTCISLIVQYSEKEELVKQLSPVVTEEWGHFRMVLRELKKRGLKLGRQRKDEYVNHLLTLIRKGNQQDTLMDRLLVAALIEARSCERFRLLSHDISDESLREFYHDLMVAEAGHYRMFIDLAETLTNAEKAQTRWRELLVSEAKILKKIELRGDRMH